MSKIDEVYQHMLKSVLQNGFKYKDPNRDGVIRTQISKYDFVYDMKDGFPAITTKKLHFRSVVGELMWFLMGDSNIKYLLDNDINIWNKDAFKFAQSKAKYPHTMDLFIKGVKAGYKYGHFPLGYVGRGYGRNWRQFGGLLDESTNVDQFKNLIDGMKKTPMSTEHIVTAWNPVDNKAGNIALPPCHDKLQCMVTPMSFKERLAIWRKNVNEDDFIKFRDSYPDLLVKPVREAYMSSIGIPQYKFDLIWDQRSCDLFLGIPFNIASYALLMEIIGKLTNMVPNMLYGSLRNVHIYENALESAWQQVYRDPTKYGSSKLEWDCLDAYAEVVHNTPSQLDSMFNLLSADIENAKLVGYESYPGFKVEMLERDK